jgi:hypothetical protein
LGDLPQADLLRLAVDLWRQISEMSGNTMDADLLRRAQEIVRQQNRGFGFDQGVQNVVDSALSVMLRESSQLFGRLLILARMPFDAL